MGLRVLIIGNLLGSKKLSPPLINHKNTKKRTVKDSFDRENLFQQTEQGYDKLFGYKRDLTESYGRYNNEERMYIQSTHYAGTPKSQ